MLLATAFTLIICTVLFLIAGLINPSWALFWMYKPGRIQVIIITAFLLMGSLTLYGEAVKLKIENAESSDASDVQQVKTEEATE